MGSLVALEICKSGWYCTWSLVEIKAAFPGHQYVAVSKLLFLLVVASFSRYFSLVESGLSFPSVMRMQSCWPSLIM